MSSWDSCQRIARVVIIMAYNSLILFRQFVMTSSRRSVTRRRYETRVHVAMTTYFDVVKMTWRRDSKFGRWFSRITMVVVWICNWLERLNVIIMEKIINRVARTFKREVRRHQWVNESRYQVKKNLKKTQKWRECPWRWGSSGRLAKTNFIGSVVHIQDSYTPIYFK